MAKRENTGTDVTAFLERLENVTFRRELQELFDEACIFPAGDVRDFLKEKCREKVKEMGWASLVESDFGC